MTRVASLLVVLAFVSMLGACSGPSVESEPATEPSAALVETSVSPTAEYAEVKDLIADMGANGVSCEDVKILDAPQESIADFGLCFIDGDKEFETDIYLFEDEEARDSWHASFAQYPDVHTLLGSNWFITSGSVDELDEIRAAIGGEIDPQEDA